MANLTRAERDYLSLGKARLGGKLPLFDKNGQLINTSIITNCVEKGFAERWFANPISPDWMVCRLTPEGRKAL